MSLAISQNFPGRNYTAVDELPNNTVRSLLLDSENSLWIGTDNGVVRKENDVFKYFFEEDGLALNSCWAIAEDRNKNLWFGSYGKGISIYDGSGFSRISKKDGLIHDEITRLFPFKNYMFVGTSDGISVIDIDSFKVQSLNIPPTDELFRIQDFFEYKDQVYVVTYKSGVFRIDINKAQAGLVRIKNDKHLYSVFIHNDSIISSKKGYFTKSSLQNYLKQNSIPETKAGHSIIWDYVKTSKNKVFAAAWGIYDNSGGIYEIKNDRFISRASDFNIPSNEVISLAYDERFEKLYVGTRDAGMFEVDLNSQVKFNKVPNKEVLDFARTSNTSAILLNDAIILKHTGEEKLIDLQQLKSWEQDYVHTTNIPLPEHKDDFYELEYGMPARNISFYDLKVFNDQYWLNTNIGIFAITENAGLYRYLPLHSEEINFTPDGKLVETNPYGGLRVYDDLDKFEYSYFSKGDLDTPTMIVNSLRLKDKTYFTSVFSGLYSSNNQEFISYLNDGIWKEEKLRHITSLGENLAISTEFGDVFIIEDGDNFTIEKKIPRARIEGNSISFLEEYKGSLLIGTEKGLTLYREGRFIFLDGEQGLQPPFHGAAVEDNTLKIGSHNGYYLLDLEAIANSAGLVNKIKLKEVFINNEKFPLEEFTTPSKAKLAYDQNTLLLKFSTNAHPYPHKLVYQYRLNKRKEWSQQSSEPEIFLPFLTPNRYNIEVRVLDKSTGLEYTQELVKFSILPPFWKTWWFALLVLMLILLIVYGIYRIQLKQAREFEAQKRQIQKRFEETKMEALLAQMNPHFIFNAMNSIQNYIMDSDIDNATTFLDDFSRLIRLNLDHCTKPTILLVEEIEYLQSYIRIENTRFNNAINIIFETDPLIDPYEIEIPTMLLQTFVENVFVHAFPPGVKAPTLKVSFKWLSEGVLQCKIKDNGIGYKPGVSRSLHQSKGVSLVKERLALLGYDIEDAVQVFSKPGKGTEVSITLQV
ncbi:histidine kinase [Pontixanthobacter gangjinensis]